MDESRFEAIYLKQSRPLWLYISRLTGNSSLADDIVQEAFLRFMKKPLETDDDSQIKPYLFKIATNLVYDYFRRTKTESKWQIKDSTEIEIEAVQTASLEAREMMQVFHQLKQQERALLWLAYVEGYGHREIAEVLHLNAMSVRVLLFRARKNLARRLEKREE